jgi:hypothetical protein
MPKEERKKAPAGFYSARDAINALGIPPSAFYGLVNAGEIKRVTPPGRKEGYYPVTVIDNYARTLQAFSAPYIGEKLDFVPALSEDLQGIHDLVASVSGGEKHAVPVDILKGWIRRNPQAVHILRRKSEILGYVSMFPLQMDTLMQRLSGQLLNREIPIDDILTFQPGSTVPLYVAEMAVKHRIEYLLNNEPNPNKPDEEAGALGSQLIREIIRFIVNLKRQEITINGFYAVGTSQYGIELCRKIGMHPIDLPTGVRPDRIPFLLDTPKDARPAIVKRLVTA